MIPARRDPATGVATAPATGGRLWTSFEFLIGDWRIENRRLRTLLPEEERTGWFEFESTAEVRPILGGAGVMDLYCMPELPAGSRHGFALRLVDPQTDCWTVWWAASSAPGRLDPPVVGGFVDGEGHFSGEDTYAGRPVLVRTEYTDITDVSLRWGQAFSFDAGRTFETNWVMRFHRVASLVIPTSRGGFAQPTPDLS